MLPMGLTNNMAEVHLILLTIILTMAKTVTLASLSGPSEVPEEKVPTDWKLCLFCQLKTNEPLTDPTNNYKKSYDTNRTY